MKQTTNPIREALVRQYIIEPKQSTIDKARQNSITKQLSRVNAILARRALTAH